MVYFQLISLWHEIYEIYEIYATPQQPPLCLHYGEKLCSFFTFNHYVCNFSVRLFTERETKQIEQNRINE